ncbi:MAG: single-stranded-DNA-specific exonuclease RecJ [Pelolinea sp.]|nr:single-stranded-DNA-specific exonuclease RecJ [Pelolinea sp.]
MIWIESNPPSLSAEIASLFNNSLILNYELAKRNVQTIEEVNAYLDPASYPQASPFSFPEMDKAVDRIIKAIRDGEIIGVWGDFDVDGQTSTAILFDGLTRMGANVVYHIPVRALESHGMQLKAFKTFIKHRPSLVITCDTGISEFETIEFARSIGVDVIITDHHTLPNTLPNAQSIINPHQLPDGHPLSYLAGVGTAFQLIRALEHTGAFGVDIASYYDLVALGTIADLAPIKSENRFYAQMGLAQLNLNLRTAFSAMFKTSQARISMIDENTLGFNIAPRLNASGRLSDANENIKFLLSNDQLFCKEFAVGLEQLNISRKAVVETIFHMAKSAIEENLSIVNEPVLILSNQGWERGVLGIAAGRLSELYAKPVILLNIENGIAAGSVRSTMGIDITAAIRENDEHLIRYGGHPMAAGLSIPIEKIGEFSRGLMKSVKKQLNMLQFKKELIIDHTIGINSISDQLLKELKQLSPFGQENSAPIFASLNLEINSTSPLGMAEKHTQITVQDVEGNTTSLINWNSEMRPIPFDRIDIAYYIRPDEYRGKNTYYLEYVDHREHVPDSINLDALPFHIEYEDHRQDMDQLLSVKEIISKKDNIQIWYEGLAKPDGLKVLGRKGLMKNKNLLILSAPQSFTILNEIINISQPELVFFFNIPNERDDIKEFLSGLGGAIKYYLKNLNADISLNALSIHLGHTEETILNGLIWFKERGHINYVCDPDGKLIFHKNNGQKLVLDPKIEANLNKSLKETSAFRKYYKRVNPNLLLRKIWDLGI